MAGGIGSVNEEKRQSYESTVGKGYESIRGQGQGTVPRMAPVS